MNYKERFAGLNANEIIKKLEEDEKPFNPLDFGFIFDDSNLEFDRFIKEVENKNLFDDVDYENLITLSLCFYKPKKTWSLCCVDYFFDCLKIPSQRFGRELLENLGVI